MQESTAQQMTASVPEAARALAQFCRGADLDGTFSPVAAQELGALAEHLSLSPELREWYGSVAPRDVAIPFDFLELRLFDPADLTERQAGYRTSAATGEPLADWPRSWLVIGTLDGEPVVAHTDRPGTPISMVEQGTGTWMPYLLAPDLASYLAALTVWVQVVVGEYQGQLRTTDWRCQLLPDARTRLEQQLAPALADPYRQRWLPLDELAGHPTVSIFS